MRRCTFAARFRSMISPSPSRVFAWSLAVLGAFMSPGLAQDAFPVEEGATMTEDSLDAMTQMWHALPEAEVGSVGLAAGSLDASEVPGSMQRLSSKALRTMAYADPIRTLHALAGLNLVEEDGFGLRPNIGMRGSGTDRSARVTLMEDGVLMAPAPYAAPSAYYFPTMARMESVEVRKGGSQIAFGPQTAGGAINLVSTKIPEAEVAGRVRLESGSFRNQQMHAFVGRLPFPVRLIGFLMLNAFWTLPAVWKLAQREPATLRNQQRPDMRLATNFGRAGFQ